MVLGFSVLSANLIESLHFSSGTLSTCEELHVHMNLYRQKENLMERGF